MISCRRIAILLALCSIGTGAIAGAAPAAKNAPGGDAPGVAPCTSCHGPHGEGNAAAGIPHLAGLPAQYLLAQLDAMAEKTRLSPVMTPLAGALNKKERWRLAGFYATLPAPAPPQPGSAGKDDRLALQGRWSDQVPGCVQCHGERGSGVGASFPPLLGQPAVYLAAQLRAWKQGARRGDPLGLMQGIANRLSEQDIVAVADYFGTGASAAAGAPQLTSSGEPAPPVAGSGATSGYFTPAERPIPEDEFGKVIRQGRDIFDNTPKYAPSYTGNDLSCSSCHLDQGRRVGSAPLWAAYVSYPAYRNKTHQVNSFAERLQGCFQYSMNGTAPALGDPVLTALESYAYWMAQGARVDPKIPGRGYPRLPRTPMPPDYERGAQVYAERCALCHAEAGQGQRANDGSPAFPALWGPNSYNWGAGMISVTVAAGFIRENMPFSQGGSLSDQDAWDVAQFVDAHERPQDPRFISSVAETRARFHDTDDSLYGKSVNGHLLGSDSVPPGPPQGRKPDISIAR